MDIMDINVTDIIRLYVVVVALFAGIPIIINEILGYLSADKRRNALMTKVTDKASEVQGGLDLKELRAILKESREETLGIPGLARSLMALTAILVLGIAVFHILVIGVAGNASPEINSQIVNNILSMLAGLLAAITGFYFGGKGSTGK